MKISESGHASRQRLVKLAVLALLAMAMLIWMPRYASAQDEGAISYGSVVEGNVTSRLGNEWKFQGCEGDEVTVEMTSDELDAYLELYGPAGRRSLAEDDNSGGGTDALIDALTLPQSGAYIVVAGGSRRSDRGPYTLTLFSANVDLDEAPSLAFDQEVAGAVVNLGGEEWTFYGCEGDVVDVRMTADGFDGYLELYGPTGRRSLAESSGTGSRSEVEIAAFSLPEAGLYTVVAAGDRRRDRGPYTLVLSGAEEQESAPSATRTRRPVLAPPPTPNEPSEPTEPSEPSEPSEPEGMLCSVISSRLNLRSGPGIVYTPPLRSLARGTEFVAIGRNESGTWLQVVLEDGDDGWVSGGTRYVECRDEIEGLPGVAAPPRPTATPSPTPTATSSTPPATPTLTPTTGATPTATATATATRQPGPPSIVVPAPIAIDYNDKVFSWRWSGLESVPEVDWYFDVKIFNNEFSRNPYDVKVAEFEAVKYDGTLWRYQKGTDFRCGSYWAVQIAQRNVDGSYAGPLSPESKRIPTNRGCDEPTPAPVEEP